MSGVFQLAYVSTPTLPLSEVDLKELLNVSRSYNSSKGISGFLLAHNNVFFQVIEGKKDEIDKLYEKICRDLRHKNITLVIYDYAEQRAFAEWSMAFHFPNTDELRNIPGFCDFLDEYYSTIDSEAFIKSASVLNCDKVVAMVQEMKKLQVGHY